MITFNENCPACGSSTSVVAANVDDIKAGDFVICDSVICGNTGTIEEVCCHCDTYCRWESYGDEVIAYRRISTSKLLSTIGFIASVFTAVLLLVSIVAHVPDAAIMTSMVVVIVSAILVHLSKK